MSRRLFFGDLDLGEVQLLREECDFPWMVGVLERSSWGDTPQWLEVRAYIEREIARSGGMDDGTVDEETSDFEPMALDERWQMLELDGSLDSVFVAFHEHGRIGWRY